MRSAAGRITKKIVIFVVIIMITISSFCPKESYALTQEEFGREVASFALMFIDYGKSSTGSAPLRHSKHICSLCTGSYCGNATYGHHSGNAANCTDSNHDHYTGDAKIYKTISDGKSHNERNDEACNGKVTKYNQFHHSKNGLHDSSYNRPVDDHEYMDCATFVGGVYHYILNDKIPEFTANQTSTSLIRGGNGTREYFDIYSKSDTTMQPGDILAYIGHAAIYVGTDDSENSIVANNGSYTNSRTNSYTHVIRIKSDVIKNLTIGDLNLEYNGKTGDSSGIIPWIGDGEGEVDRYYYNGIPKFSESAGSVRIIDKIFNFFIDALDWLLGLLTIGYKIEFIGWTGIIENLISKAINAVIGQSDGDGFFSFVGSAVINNEADKKITVDKIVFNQIPILDINIFNFEEAGGQRLDEFIVYIIDGVPVPTENIILTIRKSIATWYNAVRNFSIVCLLLVLIYVGIRMAISVAVAEKAMYKKMLVTWLASVIIVFFMHYFIAFVINTNNSVVELLFGTSTKIGQTLSNSRNEATLYETVVAKAYDFKASQGWAGTIFYMVLVYYMVRYIFVYFKRMLLVCILTIISPLVGLSYAINKLKDGKGNTIALSIWTKEFVFNVLIQVVHALLYTVFVSIAFELATSSILGMIVAFVFLNFMLKAEKIIKTIFGFKANSLKNILEATAGIMAGFAVVKGAGKIVSKGANKVAGKVIDANVARRFNYHRPQPPTMSAQNNMAGATNPAGGGANPAGPNHSQEQTDEENDEGYDDDEDENQPVHDERYDDEDGEEEPIDDGDEDYENGEEDNGNNGTQRNQGNQGNDNTSQDNVNDQNEEDGDNSEDEEEEESESLNEIEERLKQAIREDEERKYQFVKDVIGFGTGAITGPIRMMAAIPMTIGGSGGLGAVTFISGYKAFKRAVPGKGRNIRRPVTMKNKSSAVGRAAKWTGRRAVNTILKPSGILDYDKISKARRDYKKSGNVEKDKKKVSNKKYKAPTKKYGLGEANELENLNNTLTRKEKKKLEKEEGQAVLGLRNKLDEIMTSRKERKEKKETTISKDSEGSIDKVVTPKGRERLNTKEETEAINQDARSRLERVIETASRNRENTKNKKSSTTQKDTTGSMDKVVTPKGKEATLETAPKGKSNTGRAFEALIKNVAPQHYKTYEDILNQPNKINAIRDEYTAVEGLEKDMSKLIEKNMYKDNTTLNDAEKKVKKEYEQALKGSIESILNRRSEKETQEVIVDVLKGKTGITQKDIQIIAEKMAGSKYTGDFGKELDRELKVLNNKELQDLSRKDIGNIVNNIIKRQDESRPEEIKIVAQKVEKVVEAQAAQGIKKEQIKENVSELIENIKMSNRRKQRRKEEGN